MNSDNYEKNIIKQCFSNKEALLYCLERITTEKLFSDAECRLYWQIFSVIYKEGQNVCSSTVEDVLRHTKNDDLIEGFKALYANIYQDEQEWQYHLFYLDEQYRKKIIFEESVYIRDNITKLSGGDLINRLGSLVKEISSGGAREISFREAYRSTVQEIRDINDGKQKSFLATGNKEFDECISLTHKKYILISSQKKIGKTRFTIDLIDRLITLNPDDVAIQWFSLEMLSDELIRCFISRKTKLTDKQLLGKGYKLNIAELKNIEMAYAWFEKYPITFIDEPVNIFNICSKFERFKEKNSNKTCICIIDNLGLIKTHLDDTNANEDDIARMLKGLRDSTEGIIIALHHLTKESESKWNKEVGYEPKINHIRGSSRIADFANQVILLHRPDHYDDLRQMAANAGKSIDGMFQVDIAANRDGEERKIIMNHDIKYCMFYE